MARTRGGLNNAARPNTFNNRRFSAAKEIANVHRRNHQIKTKFLLPQSKKMQVKRRGNVVTELTVRRRAIYPARCWNREY